MQYGGSGRGMACSTPPSPASPGSALLYSGYPRPSAVPPASSMTGSVAAPAYSHMHHMSQLPSYGAGCYQVSEIRLRSQPIILVVQGSDLSHYGGMRDGSGWYSSPATDPRFALNSEYCEYHASLDPVFKFPCFSLQPDAGSEQLDVGDAGPDGRAGRLRDGGQAARHPVPALPAQKAASPLHPGAGQQSTVFLTWGKCFCDHGWQLINAQPGDEESLPVCGEDRYTPPNGRHCVDPAPLPPGARDGSSALQPRTTRPAHRPHTHNDGTRCFPSALHSLLPALLFCLVQLIVDWSGSSVVIVNSKFHQSVDSNLVISPSILLPAATLPGTQSNLHSPLPATLVIDKIFSAATQKICPDKPQLTDFQTNHVPALHTKPATPQQGFAIAIHSEHTVHPASLVMDVCFIRDREQNCKFKAIPIYGQTLANIYIARVYSKRFPPSFQ